ncbi:MAG: zinc-dependent peptidase [Rubrivivax sp.]|nr:MAG: zinc-dependent peptidase [Rubrivivax sp.]
MPLLIITVACLVFVGWLLAQPWLTARRRRRWQSQPFPEAWRDILRRRVPYVRALPADLQLQLKKHIQVFVAEKAFIGCAGLLITDDVRITIAAQACLLILNRPTDYYPKLRQVLVYPSAFLVDRLQRDDSGVQQDQRQALSGESWSQGQVILSWDDTLEGAAVVNDAQNVVIHEFAHQLDSETGDANGAPLLIGRQRYERWSRTMHDEFARLQHRARHQQPSLLNHYGATNPAEFFAVASETFFERPAELADQHPALYGELCDFYRVDPLSW